MWIMYENHVCESCMCESGMRIMYANDFWGLWGLWELFEGFDEVQVVIPGNPGKIPGTTSEKKNL